MEDRGTVDRLAAQAQGFFSPFQRVQTHPPLYF